MEWFGLSLYGCPDPIKDMMRPDYKEPVDPPTEPEVNIILRPEFECNSGPPDGFAYNSHRRLIALRNKAIRKPVGPYDMYKYPGCTSMMIGWTIGDCTLVGEKWYKPQDHHPQPSSEITRMFNDALKTNKYFRF